jgi:uncharacterized membrane protein YukC
MLLVHQHTKQRFQTIGTLFAQLTLAVAFAFMYDVASNPQELLFQHDANFLDYLYFSMVTQVSTYLHVYVF